MTRTKDIIEMLTGQYGLTQADITRHTGIPQPRMSRWTAGQIPHGADDALKLADLAAKLAKRNARRVARARESEA
jgi:predicted XRE-type DNA-binding protein